MIIAVESAALCLVFTLMVYIMSRDPIKTLYNDAPKIQQRVRALDEYQDRIPAKKNKVTAKIVACILFVLLCCSRPDRFVCSVNPDLKG